MIVKRRLCEFSQPSFSFELDEEKEKKAGEKEENFFNNGGFAGKCFFEERGSNRHVYSGYSHLTRRRTFLERLCTSSNASAVAFFCV